MKKLLYIIRKFFGILIILILIISVIRFVSHPQTLPSTNEGIKGLNFFGVFVLYLGIIIYPSRSKYCSCGRIYSSKSYEYVESKSSPGKIKNNIKTTHYQYKINIVNHCDHCKKDHKISKLLDGGVLIEYLDKGEYEDKKITYEEALEDFKKSQQQKSKKNKKA